MGSPKDPARPVSDLSPPIMAGRETKQLVLSKSDSILPRAKDAAIGQAPALWCPAASGNLLTSTKRLLTDGG